MEITKGVEEEEKRKKTIIGKDKEEKEYWVRKREIEKERKNQ